MQINPQDMSTRDLQAMISRLQFEVSTLQAQLRQNTEYREIAENSERRWKKILENSPVYVMIVQVDGTIDYINHTRPEHTQSGVIGTSVYHYLPHEYHETAVACFERVFTTGVPDKYECEYISENGDYVVFESRVNLLDGDRDRPTVIMAAHDVTDRKRAERRVEEERDALRGMLEQVERERRLIACDIHDGLIQYATGALMLLESSKDQSYSEELLEKTIHLIRRTIREGRQLINGIRPPILDEHGLIPAIEQLLFEAQHDNFSVRFTVQGEMPKLSKKLETTLFRIIQEGLTNIVKHSASKKAEIDLEITDQHIGLEMRDWGIGIESISSDSNTYGLQGIRKRVDLFEGKVVFSSPEDGGTLMQVMLPRAKE